MDRMNGIWEKMRGADERGSAGWRSSGEMRAAGSTKCFRYEAGAASKMP
jgi:hypothetical protein